MKARWLVLYGFLLVACDPQTPGADQPSAREATLATQAGAPEADEVGAAALCQKMRRGVARWLCEDPALEDLDRQLAILYPVVVAAHPAQEQAHSGWLKDRDACLDELNVADCLSDAYAARIVELQLLRAPMHANRVSYQCGPHGDVLEAEFYDDTAPPVAFLTLRGLRAVALRQPGTGDARYSRRGVEFREHEGEVSLVFFGANYRCKRLLL